jgi:xanthine dehydrogenase accessory factor
MEGVDTALITLFKGSQGSEKLLMKPTGERIGEGWCDNLEMPLVERALEVIHSHKKERIKLADSMELIIEPILGYPSLVIFGGGHVSKFISGFAKTCGFKVTIVDDRIQFANKERFPEVDAIVCESFAQSFEKLDISASSYVVIVTRGHKYDEQILERVLEFDAKYIGMIGSKRKVLTTFQHLVGKGVSKENLQRVYAPIGLEIGAITPEEIGLSIVSELIKIRRLGDDGPSRHMSRGLPVSDIETGCQ